MRDDRSVTALLHAREAGELERDVYWHELQKRHATLLEYVPLVERSGSQAIEITGAGLVLHLADGTRFTWDPSDLRSPPVVLINEGAYEPTEWPIIQALGSGDGTILDVGANVGWYTIRLAASGQGQLHAFEPIPRTYQVLLANIAMNGLQDSITPHPYGLSDRDARVGFFVPNDTGSVAASERQLFDNEPQTQIEVQIRRLDDVVASEGIAGVDFIKCDIEGGEFGFLRGAAGVLAEDRPTVMLEMLRKWARRYDYHPNDIIEWMAPRGYRCAAVHEGVVRRIDAVDDTTEATNYLFIHESRLRETSRALASAFADVHLD